MPFNPYLDEVYRNLPRVLSLFDGDRTSISYGMGDRYYWAWGLIDFGNGTFQGAAHGLARLWAAGLWPYAGNDEIFLARIDAMVHAVDWLTRADGSLEEAFPNEGSYCVTALVAFDLLCALDLLEAHLNAAQVRRWKEIIGPLIAYLIKADETHALISNHLATAAAALARWHLVTGDAEAEHRAKHLVDRILKHQSSEGWFCEYEGADPGYQSLCTYYLADLHQNRPDWNLLEPLRKSLVFLSFFAHPDGSFGGVYGSRCTRFYYPAGIVALAEDVSEASALAKFMEAAIANQHTVSLSAMDEPNLIPMFNAYAWAAVQFNGQSNGRLELVPAKSEKPFSQWFPEAGLLIDRGANHYTIVSAHKGGVVYHFPDDESPFIDCGVVLLNKRNQLGSTQSFNPANNVVRSAGELKIEAPITAMPRRLPRPLQFIAIRGLSLSLFRFGALREWVKRRLVALLITRKKKWPVTNLRTVRLGQNLSVTDEHNHVPGYTKVNASGPFVPIHMASQGYWQMQDEKTP